MSKHYFRLLIGVTLTITMFAAASLSIPVAAQEGEIPQIACDGVESNDDWEPYTQEFDDVEMVLVPVGCFTMGSSEEELELVGSIAGALYKNETPANIQCFDEPFWFDKYEVTNEQFNRLNGQAASDSRWQEDNLPRETVNWFEARDFCTLRGAHLPTEAEWEYAARGPDNLMFPWGNTFVEENVVYRSNSDNTTAEVGSKPDGASWVGALDMSGNAGEWTSSIFMDYPYDADDDREDNTDDESSRVLRGGTYYDGSDHIRAAVRTGLQYTPLSKGYLHGFRCALSYEDSLPEEGD
jgi:formylglycine-generating enzyme required for sulfatase activity